MRQNYLKVENGFQFESPGAGRCGCALVAPEKQRGWRFWRFMRGKKWSSSLVVLALLLNVAVAQKDNPVIDPAKASTGSQTQVAKNSANRASAASTPAMAGNAAVNADKTPDQPADQPVAGAVALPKNRVPTAQPFVEDFPPEPNEVEVVRPHGALPVILNPNSPNLDRLVRREDIQPTPEDYIIGEEDVLTVTVWKEKDISGTVVVRPDGKITVPLVGEIIVVGMKPAQLQKLLEEKLRPFITMAQVSVTVNQISSRKIYLIGQVVREGVVPINGSMTVLQVLAGAGGLRDFAKRKKIYVLRKHLDQEIRFPFDYDAAIRGRNTEQNIRVEPGDTIVVP
jgi:polysaccharide export outer membrane protein